MKVVFLPRNHHLSILFQKFPSPTTKAQDLGEKALPAKRGKAISGLSLENEAINPLKLN